MDESKAMLLVLSLCGVAAMGCGDEEASGQGGSTSTAQGGSGGSGATDSTGGAGGSGGMGDVGGGGGDGGAGGSALTAGSYCKSACSLLEACDYLSPFNITQSQCVTNCTADISDCSAAELDTLAQCDAMLAEGGCDLGWYDCVNAVACADAPPPKPM